MTIVLKALAVISYNLADIIAVCAIACSALRTSFPTVYSDNSNQLLLRSIKSWRETLLSPCKAGPRCCSLKSTLKHNRGKKNLIQAAQIWARGGCFLSWSVTQTGIKIALCLKCIVWQLAIKTLFIKTFSVARHGGVRRPEDSLCQNYARTVVATVQRWKFFYFLIILFSRKVESHVKCFVTFA